MTELPLLRAMRLKGRLSAEAAASYAGSSVPDAQAGLEELVGLGHAARAGDFVRLTAQGRERLAAMLADERRSLDAAGLDTGYQEFDRFNTELKQIVTDWQLRDGQPNDHSDQAYDTVVVERLLDLHERFSPLLARFAALAQRLSPYRDRFGRAAEAVRAGDRSYIARPIIDSYHTVWFELHEDLIGLLGRTRAAEAAAGRAV